MFRSCGYIVLCYMDDLDQFVPRRYPFEMADHLAVRKGHLKRLMMSVGGPMLGYIVAIISGEEMEPLRAVWNMSYGWGNDPRAEEVLEDGQSLGVTGRFSGCVEREDGPSS